MPKGPDGSDCRLIFHLSYPKIGTTSVNANIPRDRCSVSYPDFGEAIRLCMDEGFSCHISKSDMRSAFRQLGIKIKHWAWLVMKAKCPEDKCWYWFVDKCLPFGSAISCAHFQEFSNCIAWIVRFRTGKDLVNYLDDFLFIALLKLACNGQIYEFLKVCKVVNFPVSLEKTFWATTRLTFLGFLIDTVEQIIAIPIEKIAKGTRK